jgi:hypothetical protein
MVCKAIKADIKVSSSFYKVDQYRNLQSQNSNLQMNAARQTEAFGRFTHHAFRLHSREPRHKTHAIVIFFDFNFALGQVQHFIRYEAKPLDEMKAFIQSGTQSEMEKHQLISNYLDVENSPALLQSRIRYPRNFLLPMFAIDSTTKTFLLTASNFAEIASTSREISEECQDGCLLIIKRRPQLEYTKNTPKSSSRSFRSSHRCYTFVVFAGHRGIHKNVGRCGKGRCREGVDTMQTRAHQHLFR